MTTEASKAAYCQQRQQSNCYYYCVPYKRRCAQSRLPRMHQTEKHYWTIAVFRAHPQNEAWRYHSLMVKTYHLPVQWAHPSSLETDQPQQKAQQQRAYKHHLQPQPQLHVSRR